MDKRFLEVISSAHGNDLELILVFPGIGTRDFFLSAWMTNILSASISFIIIAGSGIRCITRSNALGSLIWFVSPNHCL